MVYIGKILQVLKKWFGKKKQHMTLQDQTQFCFVFHSNKLGVWQFAELLDFYLKVKEGLAEPVMHDGYLSCVVVEFLPDELRDERLDQQAAAEHGQVVSTEQEWHQQHQAAVDLP